MSVPGRVRPPRRPLAGWWWFVTASVLAGLLAGCSGGDGTAGTSDSPAPRAAAWFEPCPVPESSRGRAGASPSGSATGPSRAAPARSLAPPSATGSPLPELTLECFGSGPDLALRRPLGRPAVVNVWASWCGPCRRELPHLQRYADQMAGSVLVLGVVSADRRDSALALARDLDITFPTYYDGKARLTAALGRRALPVTLFVDAAGRLAHVHNGPALSQRRVAALARTHLGAG